ncbi:MAG: phosphatidylserine decarboxylase [Bacteroidales bacterium]|nr:phosphatidylserine decarboxylase [Bacteroidales bacterium]MDD3664882.1 phosphatidylserine decarboxylase [Bacteroidales bacterium]
MILTVVVITLFSLFTSTAMYAYLRHKVKMPLKFLLTDNLLVAVAAAGVASLMAVMLGVAPRLSPGFLLLLAGCGVLVVGLGFGLTMIRFWATPRRVVVATDGQMVSPADGNVIYIRQVPDGQTPVAVKEGLEASLTEIMQTGIMNQPAWLIGINMTPFDNHKNCAPVDGSVVLNRHVRGQFFSLKNPRALVCNERNSLVLQASNGELIGVVQTASRLVRRIDSYVAEGQKVKQGDWFGMIRFGSQVDLVIPARYQVHVQIGQQVYAKTTIIASR